MKEYQNKLDQQKQGSEMDSLSKEMEKLEQDRVKDKMKQKIQQRQ